VGFIINKMRFSRVFGALVLSGSAVLAATLTQVSNYGGSATTKAQM
jgi:acetylxylan esterase